VLWRFNVNCRVSVRVGAVLLLEELLPQQTATHKAEIHFMLTCSWHSWKNRCASVAAWFPTLAWLAQPR
jgi:hypothetical protein